MTKIIEEVNEIIMPVQPEEAISEAQMIALLRNKTNEIIEAINVLLMEVKIIKAKK